MCMVKQQIAGSQSGRHCDCVYFLFAKPMGVMKYETCQIVSLHWLKMASLVQLNLFSVDKGAAVGSVLWTKCFWRFSKFHQKNLCQDLFFHKVAGFQLTIISKGTGVFLWILQIFWEHLFWRSSANGCLNQCIVQNIVQG